MIFTGQQSKKIDRISDVKLKTYIHPNGYIRNIWYDLVHLA